MKFDMKVWSLIALTLLLVSANVGYYHATHKVVIKEVVVETKCIDAFECKEGKDYITCNLPNNNKLELKKEWQVNLTR